MKKMITISVVLLAAVMMIAQKAPTNQGIGLPDNGPCVAPVNQGVGFCNDQQTNGPGVLVTYDNAGKKYPVPMPGPAGPQGPPGPQGIAGPPGIVEGSQIIGKMVCKPGTGTIVKGYVATCTFTVTAIQ